LRPGVAPKPSDPPEAITGTAPEAVSVAVEVTVTGPDAIAVAAGIADRLRLLARSLGEQSSSTEVAVTAALVFTGDGRPRPTPVPAHASVQIVPAERTVRLDGEDIAFTRREFDLLAHLARNPGRVYTRAQLLQAVWGHAYISGERTVDVHVRRIRARLGGHESLVATVRGVGYCFTGPADLVEDS
jgi:DNA-binding response OmpR family regulator